MESLKLREKETLKLIFFRVELFRGKRNNLRENKEVEENEFRLSPLLGSLGKFCIPSRFGFESIADFLQELAALDERAKGRQCDLVAEHIFVINSFSVF